ncbi:MAG: glutamate--tRNA ligase, partial [Eggerthellaceae bacterium]|nr:glutamate--tRNA ligase [Eggerthellaceae bacterium]
MADDKKVRVRFAPSPTGKLHIGGARTAIYNWAFARSSGGDFILRIEDTDPTRSTEENTRIILRAMKWLGLDWDEGPETGGDFGPYFQTQRTDTYQKALDYLLEHDCAYPCFCTKEELDEKRKAAEKEQGGYAGYDGTCRCLTPEEAQKRIDAGEPCVWRIKVPKDHGPVEFEDAVYGHMSFPIDVMDDMILKRSDGTFTYNFAVVCDDINMDITHVIRGDDHLSNTPRQVLVYEALGAGVPMFAHLPMILGQDGQKLSKRHGATSVEEYKEEGYLPEALVNYLALLGWSLDGETTIIPPKTLCKDFTLERISKKHAIFDPQKLDWMDGVYLRELDARDWTEAARPWIAQAMALGSHIDAGAHIVPELDARQQRLDEFGHSSLDWDEAYAEALATIEEQPDVFELYYPLFVERINRLDEIALRMQYLFWGPNVHLDEKSVNKI